ncbi:MAG: peptidase S24/S26A/S26B, partial [Gammaproteobacteria bacterium]|nr:peptidase S24/S26A/S26B [Gammaproteobacteria bacterium]
VDRGLEPRHGKIVIAAVDGELTVKRLYKKQDEVRLMPENDDFKPIEIGPEESLHIWGVVTNVIHTV